MDRAVRAGPVARLPGLARRARDSSPVSTKLGGRHHHVKVRDTDPTTRVTTDGVYTEYFDPDVFVSRERITGDPGIDPDAPLELRVEFTKMGRHDTLVRIIQGPYEPDVAGWHGEGWEKELIRLAGLPRSDRRAGGHAMTVEQRLPTCSTRAIVRQKPLMTMPQILLMNLGFFGIQYSFGMQQTAVNPVYEFLGADPHDLPILNLAGPITGLLIQPLIGALSDRTWSPRWGRRKPFFLIGAIGCSICLFLFPFVTAVWMAVLLLWLLDASNNTAMEPYRAFIADKLPPSQLGKGFLAQSFFTGLGITLANISLFVFQKLIDGATEAGIPYWVVGSFMLGAVCSIGTVLVSVLTDPGDPAQRGGARGAAGQEGRSRPGGQGDRRGDPRHAAAAAEAGAGLLLPVVRHGLLLAVHRPVHRPVVLPCHARGQGGGRRLDRPGQRLVQHRHVQRRLLPGRLRQEAWRQVGALRLPAARRRRADDRPVDRRTST